MCVIRRTGCGKVDQVGAVAVAGQSESWPRLNRGAILARAEPAAISANPANTSHSTFTSPPSRHEVRASGLVRERGEGGTDMRFFVVGGHERDDAGLAREGVPAEWWGGPERTLCPHCGFPSALATPLMERTRHLFGGKLRRVTMIRPARRSGTTLAGETARTVRRELT